MEPFRASERDAFNGRCLAIVRSGGVPGNILLRAGADGLESAALEIRVESLELN